MFIKIKNINKKQEGLVQNTKDVEKMVIYLSRNKIWEEKVYMVEGTDKHCSQWLDKLICLAWRVCLCVCVHKEAKQLEKPPQRLVSLAS